MEISDGKKKKAAHKGPPHVASGYLRFDSAVQGLPIIIFTGYSDQLGTKSAFDIGVEALLYKPIIAGDIARVVRNVLDDSQDRQHD